MKHLKLLVLVVVTLFTFGLAETQAQVIHRPGPHGRYYHGGRYWHRHSVF